MSLRAARTRVIALAGGVSRPLCGQDPHRKSLMIGTQGAAQIAVSTEDTMVATSDGYSVTGGDRLLLSRDLHGSMVTFQWFAFSALASSVIITEGYD